MDVHANHGEHFAGGIPKAPEKWEAYVLGQQAIVNSPPKSSVGKKRRKTVGGIPTFGDFIRQHDDRERERRSHEARRRSHYPDDHKDSRIFPFDGSLVEDVAEKCSVQTHTNSPGSFSFTKRLSPRTIRNSHHPSASRQSRHKPASTRKGTPDSTLPDGSPTAFEERVMNDKARFYSSQNKRPHLRSNLSATIFASSGYQPPQPDAPRASTREQIHRFTQAPYHAWREACDAQLGDKTNMAHVPRPPFETCPECANAAIVAGRTPPIACEHSLKKLLSTGISEPPHSAAYRTAYLGILKSERQRWHTDRFGAVPTAAKSRVLRAAQQLFVVANSLYEDAKMQGEEASAPLDDAIPPRAATRPPTSSNHNKWFKNDDVRVW